MSHPVSTSVDASSSPGRALALLEAGFRPFFLGAALWAAVALGLWLAAWLGLAALPAATGATWPGPWWHAHEMLFGVVAAAAAGFLLTAVPVWTGTPPFRGAALAGLVALWAAGRVAMLAAGALPAAWVLAVDAAFLPVLALAVGRRIAAAGRLRNAPFPVVLGVMAGLDVAVHLGVHPDALGVRLPAPGAPAALRAVVDLAVLLIAIVGGRITPAFTANALRRAGEPADLRPGAEWGALGVAALVALAVADLAAPRSVWTGAAAGVGAAALLLRHAGWRPVQAARDPLLLALHLGVLWVPVGL
ncbi:MAG: NnrS family protein, partial [Myxococcota bacterium]|nr:NnrS family protein [Myxococcota bacterium]